MPKLRPQYSGDNSIKFWRKVNKTKLRRKREQLYMLGVILQNVEHDILRQMELIWKNNA